MKQIERQFEERGRTAVVLLDDDATVASVLNHAPAHDVIHLACHAVQDSEQARLLLWPDYPASNGDLTDQRIMEQLRLRPGALVVLSACSSAWQADTGGALGRGLVPAALLAGAGAVVATRVPIADAPAPRFQQEFHRRLLHGLGPAQALAETQRDCIAGNLGEALKAPDVWAAFILIGIG